MLHGERSKRVAPPKNTKDKNTYNQPKRPSTGTSHRPSTRHYRKGSPGFKTNNTNQRSSRARLHHSNHSPSLPTPNRVITGFCQPTQPIAKHRRVEPHYNTNTIRLSGETQCPLAQGADYQEWLMDRHGRAASLWRGKRGGGGGGGHEGGGGKAKAREWDG